MNIEYSRTPKHSYAIIKNLDAEPKKYKEGMLTHNPFKNMPRLKVITTSTGKEYWYDITGCISLNRYVVMEGLKEELAKQIVNSLSSLFDELENHMLDAEDIIYSAESIFVNRSGKNLLFMCVPGSGQTEEYTINSFMEELIKLVDHKDGKASRIIYGVYDLCEREGFTRDGVKQFLQESPDERQEAEAYVAESGYLFGEKKEFNPFWDTPAEIPWLDQEEKPAKKRGYKRFDLGSLGLSKKKKRKKQEQSNDEILLYDDREAVSSVPQVEETVCFSDVSFKGQWELSTQNMQLDKVITLNHFPFTIGKDRNKADGIVQLNTVSRIHAVFTQEDEKLYIEDFSSTNGTYVNGHLLPLNQKVEIKEGDNIVFGTAEYTAWKRMVRK